MYAALKALQFLTLCLMLGAPLFWWALWCPIFPNQDEGVSARFLRRMRRCMLLGGTLFVVASITDAIRAASQVVDPTMVSEVGVFLVASRYGQMALLKAIFASLCIASFFLAQRFAPWVGKVSTALCGVVTIFAISLASHAAAKPGIAPLLSDVLHLVGVVTWGGGLGYFLLIPWQAANLGASRRLLRRLVNRFSMLALFTVVLIAITGSISAFWHLYGWGAFTATPYGRTVLGKVVLFVLAMGIAGVHLLVILPAWTHKTPLTTLTPLVQRFLLLLRIETACVLGVVGLAGLLTTYPPAERAGYIARNTWQLSLPPLQMQLTMAPADEPGLVQFALHLHDQHGQPVPPETRVTLVMQMLDHDMGLSRTNAALFQPGQYTAPGRVSMAGNWQVQVQVQPPGTSVLSTAVDFEAATGTLERGRERRVEWSAILASVNNIAVCVIGLGSGLVGIFAIWASRRGWLPVWGTACGTVLLLWGSGMILSIILVDAYPTTYIQNPVALTAEAVTQGHTIFQTHCALCHGPAGHGDGPGAAGLEPKPANLTEAHVDEHTDGDMFWWVTYGIPGTAMPAWEEKLAATERWQVIHFVRSLRRQTSGQAG